MFAAILTEHPFYVKRRIWPWLSPTEGVSPLVE